MKRLLMLALCLCGLAMAADEKQSQPALTIYNQNFVVVREHLPLDLKSGVNFVTFSGVTSHLEPDSVILRDPTGRMLQVLEQNYRNDPVSQELLLSRYEGKTIDFIVGQDGPKFITVKGKVIRSGYVPSSPYSQAGYPTTAPTQPLIEVDGILRFGLPGQPLFPALADDSILKPTLNWQLQTDRPGASDAEISYVSGGMSWNADYNLVLTDAPSANSGANLVDLVGWITMQNHSGKTFQDARIKLMAGDVNKIQPNGGRGGGVFKMQAQPSVVDMAAPPVSEKAFDEFHLYTLERSTTLHDEETKQVEFVRAPDIHSQRLYIYDGANLPAYAYYNGEQAVQDPNYGTQSNPKVWVMQEFKNSEANHLGIPLPKGRLRFYRRDTDGHLEFIGENQIDHTPKDETLRLYTGNSFDITGERKRTNFHIDSHQRWIEESFEIHVRNHKKQSVQVRVVEHLYRWSNWDIQDKSSAYVKKDAQTVEFPQTVAPDGEQAVTYTVHYSW
jgi:hypothetical protein